MNKKKQKNLNLGCVAAMVDIRRAVAKDHDDIWKILKPIIRAGETYALPRDMTAEAALKYWFAPEKQTFVAEDRSGVVGTYYLRANQLGGGGHVANCGYVTAAGQTMKGVARAMCADSLERARAAGFKAMQFNLVVSSNERAVRLWRSFGFEIVGRLPAAFERPGLGFVDGLVMFLKL